MSKLDLDSMEIDCLIEELEQREKTIGELRTAVYEAKSKRLKALKSDVFYGMFGAVVALTVCIGISYLLYQTLFHSEPTEQCYIEREFNRVEGYFVKRVVPWAVDPVVGFSIDYEGADKIARTQDCVMRFRKEAE